MLSCTLYVIGYVKLCLIVYVKLYVIGCQVVRDVISCVKVYVVRDRLCQVVRDQICQDVRCT